MERKKMTLSSVAKLIVLHRKEKKWTRKELAEQSGLKERTIRSIENVEGTTGLSAYNKIAEALEIDFEISIPTKI